MSGPEWCPVCGHYHFPEDECREAKELADKVNNVPAAIWYWHCLWCGAVNRRDETICKICGRPN